jgi:hypothetical protein
LSSASRDLTKVRRPAFSRAFASTNWYFIVGLLLNDTQPVDFRLASESNLNWSRERFIIGSQTVI